jgi:hypothetical protein
MLFQILAMLMGINCLWETWSVDGGNKKYMQNLGEGDLLESGHLKDLEGCGIIILKEKFFVRM